MRSEKIKELKKLIDEVKFTSMKMVQVQNDDKFISSVPYDVTLKNGMVIRREKILKKGKDGSAAVILPLTTNGEVVLTVEPRVFTNRGVGVGLPAGYIERGESAFQAANRELKEETGYSCPKYIELGGFYQDMGCSAAYNRLFLGLDCRKTCEPHFDEGEIVETFLCTFDEAYDLIRMGYIEGCNAIITLERAKNHVKKLDLIGRY